MSGKRNHRPWCPTLRMCLRGPHARVVIRQRDGDACWICGRVVIEGYPQGHDEQATIDHVIPLREGGPNTIDNVRLAHRHCNEAREGYRVRITPGMRVLLDMIEMMLVGSNQLTQYEAEIVRQVNRGNR